MNKKAEILQRNVLQAHKSTDASGKKLLENLFGTEIFNQKITDRIKTYEDACEETREIPVDVDKMLEAGFTMDEIVYRKLKTITQALNEGYTFDMLDTNQKKWIPCFKVDRLSPSGFVFDRSFCDCSVATAGDASRLCFESKELSNYAGETFTDLYAQFIK